MNETDVSGSDGGAPETARRSGGAEMGDGSPLREILTLSVTAAVLFGLGLLITESVGEVGTDVDLKPFFLPYLLIAAVRFGIPTLSVAVGAAVGEGVLDVFEGYEIDDPVGFIGYVVGFLAFGWYLHEVAADPTSRRAQAVAAILGGGIQAAFEAVAFLIFTDGAALDAAASLAGNTLSHGFLLGVIPLVLLSPVVVPRLEAALG